MSATVGPHLRQHFAGWSRRGMFDDGRLLMDAALRGLGVAVLSRALVSEALAQAFSWQTREGSAYLRSQHVAS